MKHFNLKNISVKTKALTAISACIVALCSLPIANSMGDIKMPDDGNPPIKKPAIYLYSDDLPKMVNVRLDYGFDKAGQTGFLFSINEAF